MGAFLSTYNKNVFIITSKKVSFSFVCQVQCQNIKRGLPKILRLFRNAYIDL